MKKDRWDSGKHRLGAYQQTPFPDIQIKHVKVVILLLANIFIPHRCPTTENLNDLEFDLSRSLKVKFDSAIGLLIYGFHLMFNSTCSNRAFYYALYEIIGDIKLQSW